MMDLRQAAISGAHPGLRSPIFSQPATGGFFGNRSLGQARLGDPNIEWYNRAKVAVQRYDDLIIKAARIANKAYREEVLSEYFTDPSDEDGARYRRNTVAYKVGQADSYTPTNYLVFGDSMARNRVEKLEDWVHNLQRDVDYGETNYELMPEPVIKIEEEKH